jgi:hypothetical protein
MKVRALTLYQPWASLVALGAKKLETRSWSTSYRGVLAIHAAKRFSLDRQDLCEDEPFRTVLRTKYSSIAGLIATPAMPLGCIVAICRLTDVVQITVTNAELLSVSEIAFGDYTPGRYAWSLDNVHRIKPVPARGHQRIWNWNVNEVNGEYRQHIKDLITRIDRDTRVRGSDK